MEKIKDELMEEMNRVVKCPHKFECVDRGELCDKCKHNIAQSYFEKVD